MIKAVKLSCALMGNNEIMFNGRSLGFLTEEEIKLFVDEDKMFKGKISNVKFWPYAISDEEVEKEFKKALDETD